MKRGCVWPALSPVPPLLQGVATLLAMPFPMSDWVAQLPDDMPFKDIKVTPLPSSYVFWWEEMRQIKAKNGFANLKTGRGPGFCAIAVSGSACKVCP